MSKEADRVAKFAAEYVSRGLRVVRLYGVMEPGVCTCRKGRQCPNPGKHPTGSTWEVAETEEQVFGLFVGTSRFNMGIILGPSHGDSKPSVIDVECDDEAAETELRRLGLDRVATPTWSSGRGLHRLFLWHSTLPQQAVVKRAGIEFRIGGGEKRAQSVAPPSVHHFGSEYQWRAGYSLNDVDISPLPDALRDLLLRPESVPPAIHTPSRRSLKAIRGPVRDGERNESLFRAACFLARAVSPGDEEFESSFLEILRTMNTLRFVPPLEDSEVVGVWRSALKYRRKTTATECLLPGVEVDLDGGRTLYRPTGWELTIRQGDPTVFELRCEALEHINGTGIVSVPPDVWMDSRKMRDALAAEFPGICIDRFPGDFSRLWSGEAPKAGSRNGPAREATPGLRVQLERDAVANDRRLVETDPAKHRLRELVGVMVATIDRGSAASFVCDRDEGATDDDRLREIMTSGIMVMGLVNGRLYFKWDRLWQNIGTTHRLDRGDPQKVARAMASIIGRKWMPERIQANGERGTLRSLRLYELEQLRAFGAGVPSPPVTTHAREEHVSAPGQIRVAGMAPSKEDAA